MADQKKRQDTARSRPSSSVLAEQRDKFVRAEIEKERAVTAAKTAKLRALRLAKEAVDEEAQRKLAVEKPDSGSSSGARAKAKPSKNRIVRY
jgi:hypothetical protein